MLTGVLRALMKQKRLEYSSVVVICRLSVSTVGENINLRTILKKMLITA